MPSNTAFLESSAGLESLPKAYDGMGRGVDSLAASRSSGFDKPDMSPRMLAGLLGALRGIGIDIDENNAALKALRIYILTNYSLYALYRVYRAKVVAQTIAEVGAAIGESAIPANWPKIPLGIAGAGLAYGSFKVGEKFGSGDWSFSGFDFTNPIDRRAVNRKLRGLTGGS